MHGASIQLFWCWLQDKAVTVGEGKEADAATKQLSKKAKKKAAKEAEANAQTAGCPSSLLSQAPRTA